MNLTELTATYFYTILIPALPLLGFFIHILFKNRISEKLAGIHASVWVVISFVLSCMLFFRLQQTEGIETELFNWFTVGSLSVPFAFQVDHLSIIMMLVITGVGSLIHVYSIGYMHGDEGFNRFFAYLNLFVFFMLLLVMANNYVLMFVGWEGVGLCSYLLIGFWFKNTEYNKAANKAFIMNRIGDLAMLFGLFLMFQYYGSLTYSDVFSNAGKYVPDTNTITAITILLFIGACGKSAQIPLYTWLPDAMAGPTPVSALIHAATMVTAGIYMIVRSNILFALAPFTQDIILTVGIVTSVLAGTIALKQNDIKKVLAYSTVSQLGLMFFALGAGAYEAGFFHLVTHAFFKALLFLGAGSVIHGLGGEQDIRNMGGLKKHMKTTHLVFAIAVLAIMAVPPFSGFFSKDTILVSVYEKHPLLWAIGLLSGLITVFYMMRLYYLVFTGEERMSNKVKEHIHESPAIITVPLIVLCVLSVVGGIINIPHLLGGDKMMMHYLENIVPVHEHGAVSISEEWILMLTGLVAVAATILFARSKYVVRKNIPESDAEVKGIGKVLHAKYYVDEAYEAVIVKPWKKLSEYFSAVFEKYVVDGAVHGTARLVEEVSNQLRLLQTGTIGFYVFTMAIGILCLVIYKFLM